MFHSHIFTLNFYLKAIATLQNLNVAAEKKICCLIPSDLKAAEKKPNKRQKQGFLQNAYEINIFKIASPLNYVKLRQ